MSECTRLSDRIPAIATGRSEWMPEEMDHLRGCESCRREWELVQLTQRLGHGRLLELDASLISSALLRRLEAFRRSRRRTRSLIGLATAAGMAALLWTSNRSTPGPDRAESRVDRSSVAVLQIPLPELEGLQPAELDSLLRTMDAPVDNTALENPELGDLDSAELEAVLESWEG
jgi:hypothetical protein